MSGPWCMGCGHPRVAHDTTRRAPCGLCPCHRYRRDLAVTAAAKVAGWAAWLVWTLIATVEGRRRRDRRP